MATTIPERGGGPALLRLLAWLSPAFPVGSFSYSHGLERAVHDGLVADRESLAGWLATLVEVGSGWNDAVLAAEADDKVYNIIQMIYRARVYEGASKDYEFSRRTMEEHWKSGYSDMTRTLGYPEVLQRPTSPDGVFTFDLKRQPGQ